VSNPSRVLILNGPNLNMLGVREPSIYGRDTLDDIAGICAKRAGELDLQLDFRQSNHEGELVTWIQQARGTAAGIIINPAAYGHTSVALLDALLISELPVIEVHLSNNYRREEFRHHTYVSQAASGIICGLGAQGYLLALDALATILKNKKDR